MKYLIVLLCCSFSFSGRSQTVEFDVKSTEKLFYPSPYLYNDGSLDINFYKEAVYAYNADGELKEAPFKEDAESKIKYKVQTLLTDNILIDYKTDTRYVLFPEYYGLSNKEDQRISGCGSILIEKLGTKGAEVTHALFEDPDCANYQKGAYFMSSVNSYFSSEGDVVFLVSMKKISKSVTDPITPEKGIKENCVKRIILNPVTNKVEVSVHLINKVPVAEEEYTKANFIGGIDGKLYFAYTYTLPKTKQITVDIWSVNESTSEELKEYTYRIDVPKGSSPGSGRMEVVSNPEKSGIAFYYGFGLWEGNQRSAHYKILEIHPDSQFKISDIVIPDEIMTFGLFLPKLNYYDAGDMVHYFILTESDMLTVNRIGDDQIEMHVEKDINFTDPLSASLFFDERAKGLRTQYLNPIYENPESICKGCKVFKRGIYRVTENNEATFVSIEFLKTCTACDTQHMRVRIVSDKFK